VAPERVRLVEGIYSSGASEAIPDFELRIRNSSSAAVRLPLKGRRSHQLDWALVDARGARFRPTFLPPPMPRPEPPPPMVVLKPGEERAVTGLRGLSGFERADDGASEPRRWYRSLPPGTYKLTVSKVAVDSSERRFSCPPVTLQVVPGDAAVAGLRLTLKLDRKETDMADGGGDAKPVRLSLVATNEGQAPLTLDMTPGKDGPLELQLRGESLSSSPSGDKPGEGQASGLVTIPAGQSKPLRHALELPGVVAGHQHHLRKPGWYQLRFALRRPDTGPACGAGKQCWKGTVFSNMVWLQVR